jgi:anaerobic magnesium-protoporphyrin IX monomethyl ester cyclase
MRADGIDPTVAAALKTAGCATVWIGAESGSQRVLDAMEKGTRVEQIDRAATLLREAGIEVCFFLQFGFPGETLAEIELTLDMVRRNRPDDIGISVSYPLPGTPFYERVRAQLGDKQNWVDSSDLDMMYQATFSPDFYRTLHTFVHAKFRAWRAGAALRALATGSHRTVRHQFGQLGAGLISLSKLPMLSRRLRELTKTAASANPTPILVPILSRQAAALPTEQRH